MPPAAGRTAAGRSNLRELFADDAAAHQNPHYGGHHETARPAAGIAETVKTANRGVEILVHLHTVAVKFQLGRVEKSLHRGKAGNHVVNGVNEIDDVYHRAVGKSGGDVPGDRIGESRTEIRLGKLLLPSPLAVENVAEALDENVPGAEHIRKLPHLFRVFDRLIEGGVEVVGAENRNIGVVGFQLLVGVTVHNGEPGVVIFLTHKAAGILTEGANLVLEGLRIADELRFVENAVDRLHDLIPNLDANADVNGAGLMGNPVLGADALISKSRPS